MMFEDCIANKQVKKIVPNKGIAASLHELATLRLLHVNGLVHATLKVEAYYEIMKELITALLALHGFKSYSHECLIHFVQKEYSSDFTGKDLHLMEQLRVMRHDIAYRGVFVENDYLDRNEAALLKIIQRLEKEVKKGL